MSNLDLPAERQLHAVFYLLHSRTQQELGFHQIDPGPKMRLSVPLLHPLRNPAQSSIHVNLCDLSTEFWGIPVSGEFEKRDKEGNSEIR